MSRSSSIFSFDTLTGLPRPTRCFWLTVGLCAALRVAMIAGESRLERIPAQCTNQRQVYLEETLVRQAAVRPRILLMGSSLARYGLREEQVAAAAGVGAAEVVNLGLENGSAFNALVLLRRNPELASSVRLIVYAIHPGEINPESRARWIEYFYPYSTLSEKLTADRWSDRGRLVLDWVWPFRSQRRDLATWLSGLSGRGTVADADGPRPAWETGLFDRLKSRSGIYEQPPKLEDLAGIGAAVSAQHLGHLNDFIAYCRERSIRLCLVTTPTRRVYERVVEETPVLREGMERFERLIGGLGVEYVFLHKEPARSRIGLEDKEDFLDYCHLTPEGARKLTATAVAILTEQGVLARSGLEGELKTVAAR